MERHPFPSRLFGYTFLGNAKKGVPLVEKTLYSLARNEIEGVETCFPTTAHGLVVNNATAPS